MKILSVVTLVSPDGAYGGPLRVAINQAVGLIKRGHQVTIVAGHRGYNGHAPSTLGNEIPARLFTTRRLIPKSGFAGLSAPGMLAELLKAAGSYDVAHVHLARDLVTLPAAATMRARGVPYVLQTHGMVDASSHPLARVLDPVLTLPTLRAAHRVLYLTDTERNALRQLMGNDDTLEHVVNGVPATDLRADPTSKEVLYLARLAFRKRPRAMVDIANSLTGEFPQHRFRLVGPDEGEAAGLLPAMQGSVADIAWEGPLNPNSTLSRMTQAGLYVLPSVDEPYCMSVLEAMSVGLPVVITESNGLASLVRRRGTGLVTGTDTGSIAEAVRTLMADPIQARQLGEAGVVATREELSMDAIAERLESIYASAA